MSIEHDTIVGEVRVLHEDLARWLGAADAPDALAAFTGQLHPDFSMVGLDGAVVPLAPLAAGLRGAGNSTPGLTIDITDIDVLHRSADCAVVRFREVHHRPEGPAARVTTALLLPDPQARNGLRWRTVHETATTG
ncbi:hypothetical protein [Nocardia sp. XZ_19_385]|uniref:hypothetical protein n=1 Tax=Nocardia sp. XZ_19_385 TaxID=2769488 RepID=UPI00188F75AE|nr:hypothetical protein [Nocardia sp. XZ_19_385]